METTVALLLHWIYELLFFPPVSSVRLVSGRPTVCNCNASFHYCIYSFCLIVLLYPFFKCINNILTFIFLKLSSYW